MVLTLWSGLILLSAVMALSLAIITAVMVTLRRPWVDRSVAMVFLAMQIDLMFWVVFRLLEFSTTDVQAGYLWLRLWYASASLFPLFWYALATAWDGSLHRLPRTLASLTAVKAGLFLAVLSDGWHHLFFSDIVSAGSPGGVEFSRGPLYLTDAAFTYVCVALGLLVYVRSARSAIGWVRGHSRLTLIVAVPAAAAALPWFAQLPNASIDYGHLAVSVGAAVYAFSLFRYWLLDMAQVALAQAAAHMGDAVVVLDARSRVLDANHAFAAMVGRGRNEIVGSPIAVAAAGIKDRILNYDSVVKMLRRCHSHPDEPVCGDVVIDGPTARTYEMSIWPMESPGEVSGGWVTALRDVTEARATTRSLREAVADLEAVNTTAVAVTSVHDLASILGVIITDMRRLTGADRVLIRVVGRQTKAYVFQAEHGREAEAMVKPLERQPSQLSREIMDRQTPMFVEDTRSDEAQSSPGIRSSRVAGRHRAFAGVPLVVRGRTVGILYVNYVEPRSFGSGDRRLIQTFASHAAVAIANAQMLDEANQAAHTDQLTGLANHRCLMDRLDAEMNRARRSGHPLAVMMLDIDNFKLVNDNFGHTVGDRILALIAQLLVKTLRSTDFVARYGGDEFMVLLPETDRITATAAARRLIAAVRAERCWVDTTGGHAPAAADEGEATSTTEGPGSGGGPPGSSIPLHVSVGVALFPHDSSSKQELIDLADTAMYASKSAGGDTATLANNTDSAFLASQSSTFSVLEGLVNAVDGKDRYTRVHSEKVAHYAVGLAGRLGLPEDTTRRLRVASLLHDVGKIGIPDRILRKPRPLDPEERAVVQQHPLLGEMIMREVPQLPDVLDAVRHHHEWYDGSGYPRGLQGPAIPLLSRVIAVADAYSAMTADRPYRRALAHAQAIEELRKGAGTQFDPELVNLFIEYAELSDGPEDKDPPALAS